METLKHLRGKNLWIVLGALALAATVLVVLATWVPKGESTDQPAEGVTGQATPPPAGASLPQSYLDAMAYHDAHGTRFQFDQYCQAIPKVASVKNGSKIMLDNRSGDARVVKVGGTAYSLAGYGWRIVRVSSSTVPKTIYFDCGSARNVGTINLQP